MSGFELLLVALVVAVPVGFAVIIGIIFLVGRSRPQPGLGPHPGGSAPGAPPSSGVWNAVALDGSFGATDGTRGTVRVQNGQISFTTDGSGVPAWSFPCQQVSARAGSMLTGSGVELWTPQGELGVVVSREHINSFSQNTLKTMRLSGYARELVAVLVTNGAQAA